MVIRLSDFAKKESNPAGALPAWVTTETTKKLYTATITIFEDIKTKITKKPNLPIRERKIISRQIALHCNLSPSIIVARRQPEIVQLIINLNEELEILYKSCISNRSTSGKKLTKEELIKENRALKKENARLRDLAVSEALTNFVNSTLPTRTRETVITIQELRNEIQRLEKVISNQAEQNRKYMDSLN